MHERFLPSSEYLILHFLQKLGDHEAEADPETEAIEVLGDLDETGHIRDPEADHETDLTDPLDEIETGAEVEAETEAEGVDETDLTLGKDIDETNDEHIMNDKVN